MSIYVKILEPFAKVPFLSKESLDIYEKHNVLPHIGTSYGEVEKKLLKEMRLANKLGCDLMKLEKLEIIELNL